MPQVVARAAVGLRMNLPFGLEVLFSDGSKSGLVGFGWGVEPYFVDGSLGQQMQEVDESGVGELIGPFGAQAGDEAGFARAWFRAFGEEKEMMHFASAQLVALLVFGVQLEWFV